MNGNIGVNVAKLSMEEFKNEIDRLEIWERYFSYLKYEKLVKKMPYFALHCAITTKG